MAALGLVDTLPTSWTVRGRESWKGKRIHPDCMYDSLTWSAFYEAA